MKKIIVTLGTPLSGKKTHAKLLSKKLNYKLFSSGEFILEEIKNETKFGIMAKKYIDMGQDIPDERLIPFIKEEIINLKEDGIIFNGYPKNITQAKSLDSFLFARKTDKVIPIFLNTDHTAMSKRIMEKTNKELSESIKAATNKFESETKKIVDYYKNKIYFDTSINSIEENNETITTKINEICQ